MFKPLKSQLCIDALFNFVKENQFPFLFYLPIIAEKINKKISLVSTKNSQKLFEIIEY